MMFIRYHLKFLVKKARNERNKGEREGEEMKEKRDEKRKISEFSLSIYNDH